MEESEGRDPECTQYAGGGDRAVEEIHCLCRYLPCMAGGCREDAQTAITTERSELPLNNSLCYHNLPRVQCTL